VSRVKLVALLAAAAALVVPAQAAAGGKHDRDRPSRVLILVLDQARPDTIKRYDMDNVEALQRAGMSFPNALVGHMAAETVTSHNVLTSGLFPKNMGWTNEVYRDTKGLVGGGYHVTSSMSCAEYQTLIRDGGYRKLQDYLDDKFGEESMFASIAQKRTSACTAGHTGQGHTVTDDEDIIFQIRGSGRTCEEDANWRRPEFVSGQPAPLYFNFTDTCEDRWWTWQPAGAYGTATQSPADLYPLDGNRFVPGFDPDHIGGDNWSADATIRVIKNDPRWHGMMVSLGAIDKMGHMWGPEDDEPGFTHLPFAAKNADRQVGRIVKALREKGLLDETLIVITADHAAQTGHRFHGELEGVPSATGPRCEPPSNGIRSDCNWYFGAETVGAPPEVYLDPSDPVDELGDRLAGNLAFSYQDGHVAAWLHGDSDAQKRAAAEAVLDMPDVIASYRVNAAHDNYRLHDTNRMSGKERSWFRRHAEELVDTMAHPTGPEVVGLLKTNVTYGVMGDHGGHNKLIQNIPMVFYGPGVSSRDSSRELRHVDVMPTVLKAMGIDYDDDDFDGEAVRLSQSRR
jgi:hypothetical protein